jgi:uncharacterized protein
VGLTDAGMSLYLRRPNVKKYLGALFFVIACVYAFPVSAAQDETEKAEHSQKMSAQAVIKCKVVIHLDWDEEPRLVLALGNIRNLFKEVPPQQCRVNVVANRKAVTLFRKDKMGERGSEISELQKSGVRFKVCRNALAMNKIDTADLHEACETVPAGILEPINLQQEGFAYAKP